MRWLSRLRHIAAKDRTFKTVRPSQGTASGTADPQTAVVCDPQDLTMATSTRSHVDAFGIQMDGLGKNGHSAPFSWAA
jgi:hypothetical protein